MCDQAAVLKAQAMWISRILRRPAQWGSSLPPFPIVKNHSKPTVCPPGQARDPSACQHLWELKTPPQVDQHWIPCVTNCPVSQLWFKGNSRLKPTRGRRGHQSSRPRLPGDLGESGLDLCVTHGPWVSCYELCLHPKAEQLGRRETREWAEAVREHEKALPSTPTSHNQQGARGPPVSGMGRCSQILETRPSLLSPKDACNMSNGFPLHHCPEAPKTGNQRCPYLTGISGSQRQSVCWSWPRQPVRRSCVWAVSSIPVPTWRCHLSPSWGCHGVHRK